MRAHPSAALDPGYSHGFLRMGNEPRPPCIEKGVTRVIYPFLVREKHSRLGWEIYPKIQFILSGP